MAMRLVDTEALDPPTETLGDRLRRARKKAGYTSQQLGEMLGVEGNSVTKWERNEAKPNVGRLLQIALACEVPGWWLRGYDSREEAERDGLFSTIWYPLRAWSRPAISPAFEGPVAA